MIAHAPLAWAARQVVLDAEALEVARINVDRHGLADRIRLLRSDGLAALPGPYDLILCNPPYVNARSMAQLPAEYRAEPEIALAGGTELPAAIRGCMRVGGEILRRIALIV